MSEDEAARRPRGGGGRITRVPEGRILAGVCTGLGAFTRIDPVIFRVGFALLTLTNGGGIPLYIGAALLMAGEPDDDAVAERWLRRRFDGETVLAVLCGLLGLGLLLNVAGHSVFTGGIPNNALAMLTVLAIGLLVAHGRGVDLIGLVRSMPERLHGAPLAHTGPSGRGAGHAGHRARGGHGAHDGRGATATATATATVARSAPVSLDKVVPAAAGDPLPLGMIDLAAYSSGQGTPAATDTPAPGGAATGETATAASRGPRTRPILSWVTLLVALITAGALIPVVAGRGGSGAHNVEVVAAAALMVIGAGLVLGSFLGRGRGLAATGALLSLVLMATSVAGEVPVNGRYGDVKWRPGDTPSAQRPYRMIVGGGRLDLTALPLQPGNRVVVNAEFVVGRLQVTLPRAARTELHLKVGMGDITVDRHVTSGPSAEVQQVLQPDDSRPAGVHGAPGRPATPALPVIELHVRGRLGDLEVQRA